MSGKFTRSARPARGRGDDSGREYPPLPDFTYEVTDRVADDWCVIYGMTFRGRHAGPFRGIPATGRLLWALLRLRKAIGRMVGGKAIVTPEARFEAAWQVPEQARAKVLTFLAGVTQAQSDRRPGPEEWSVGEVTHHLILVERRVASRMVKVITAGREEPLDHAQVVAGRPFPLEAWADVARSGKGKAAAEVIPTAGLKMAGLIADLRAAREETRRTLMPYRQKDLSRLWDHHPRLGPLTLYERIAGLGYHERKHLAQMERTLACTG